jgi:hypothetical protein
MFLVARLRVSESLWLNPSLLNDVVLQRAAESAS